MCARPAPSRRHCPEAPTLATLDAAALHALPSYDHTPITRDRERELQRAVRGQRSASHDSPDFYTAPEFVLTTFRTERGGGASGYMVVERERLQRPSRESSG